MTHALFAPDVELSPASDEYIVSAQQTGGFGDLLSIRIRKIKEAVATVVVAASENGWDGPGSVRVNELTRDQASRLAELLPRFLPAPEVFGTPTGELVFSWDDERDNSLSVLVVNNLIGFASAEESETMNFAGNVLPETIQAAAIRWLNEGR